MKRALRLARSLATTGPLAIVLAATATVARADDEGPRQAVELGRAVDAAVGRAAPWVVRIDTIGGIPPGVAMPEPEQGGGARRQPPGGGGGPGGRGGGEQPDPRQMLTAPGFKRSWGPMTGVIVSRDGLIVTTTFALERHPRHVFVTLADGRRLLAQVKGRDEGRGLVCLRVDADDLPAPDAVAEAPPVGAWAIALGRGLGGAPEEKPAANLGIVSAHGRLGGRVTQTSARTSPLNYGGALVDVRGRMIGVIVALGLGGQRQATALYGSGIGFCVPWGDVLRIAPALDRGEVIQKGWLGVACDPQFGGPGARIRQVLPGSPAQRAGLQVGDVIAKVDEEEIATLPALRTALQARDAGDEVVLTIQREGKDPFEVGATLGVAPAPGGDAPRPSLPPAPRERPPAKEPEPDPPEEKAPDPDPEPEKKKPAGPF